VTTTKKRQNSLGNRTEETKGHGKKKKNNILKLYYRDGGVNCRPYELAM